MMKYVIIGLAIIGAIWVIDGIIQDIKFKIGIYRYYKKLYKEHPEKNPKNQKN